MAWWTICRSLPGWGQGQNVPAYGVSGASHLSTWSERVTFSQLGISLFGLPMPWTNLRKLRPSLTGAGFRIVRWIPVLPGPRGQEPVGN